MGVIGREDMGVGAKGVAFDMVDINRRPRRGLLRVF